MTSLPRVSRLKELGEAPSPAPFVRASQLTSTSLYWLGVSAWPPTFRDRLWILAFFNKLIAFAEAEWKVIPLQFLTMKAASADLSDTFLRNAREVMPIMGAMVRPGRALVAMPSPEQIEQASQKKITLASDRYTDDFTYWFVRGKAEQQRSLFQVYGGMTMLLVAPEEAGKASLPKVPKYVMEHPSMAKFKAMDMESEVRVAEMLGSDFGKKSKELFGESLKEQAIFPSLPFVLPQWSSANFFDAKPDDLKALFSLCKLYVQESGDDKGILLACKENLDEPIGRIVAELKVESELEYTR